MTRGGCVRVSAVWGYLSQQAHIVYAGYVGFGVDVVDLERMFVKVLCILSKL